MAGESPELGELLLELMAAVKGSMAACLPAKVLTYNPVDQTATVKPAITGRYHDPELEALIPAPLPVIAKVPVAFPSGGGFSITWPLLPDDDVLLVFADRSLDEWKSTGLPENLPADTRRFDLTDAIAIPAVKPPVRPISPAGVFASAMVIHGADIRLGSSAAASPVALAPLLSAFLATLKLWLDGHTHTGVTTGGGISGPPVPANLSPTAGNLGAVKVKAE